jgi:hypothetical protein
VIRRCVDLEGVGQETLLTTAQMEFRFQSQDVEFAVYGLALRKTAVRQNLHGVEPLHEDRIAAVSILPREMQLKSRLRMLLGALCWTLNVRNRGLQMVAITRALERVRSTPVTYFAEQTVLLDEKPRKQAL